MGVLVGVLEREAVEVAVRVGRGAEVGRDGEEMVGEERGVGVGSRLSAGASVAHVLTLGKTEVVGVKGYE